MLVRVELHPDQVGPENKLQHDAVEPSIDQQGKIAQPKIRAEDIGHIDILAGQITTCLKMYATRYTVITLHYEHS